jgi:ankyrin repeat protein
MRAVLFGVIVLGAATVNQVSLFTPVDVNVPATSGASRPLQVRIPNRPGSAGRLAPVELFASVQASWAAVVEPQQAGLMDAKAPQTASLPLTQGEAWHHYAAANTGTVDSARFLISFAIVPSLQAGGTLLHLAAAVGALERVAALLRGGGVEVDDSAPGAEVDALNDHAHSALVHAAAMGHAPVVRALLAAGAAVERRGRDGATPLMIAAAFGHADVVDALLAAGADASAAHAFAGSTALHFAAEMGRVDVIRGLCAASPAVAGRRTSIGGLALHTASDCNQSLAIPVLVAECGCEVNALLAGDTTPLYLAAQRGFTTVVEALAAAGADVDAVMPQEAVYRGGKAVAPVETASGPTYAPVNTKQGNGATALHAAVENGHEGTVAALLRLGAHQLTSMEGASPLLLALQYRHPRIALLLLQGRPASATNVNVRTPHDGVFPLLEASRLGFADVVEALLRAGARPELKSRSGLTALVAARRGGHKGIIALLEAAGAVT